MLRLEQVSKRYASGIEALSEVSVEIGAGEVVALIGPSGAGKSTLLRCINRLVEPSSGRIFVGATEMTGLSTRRLRAERAKIGMIFQEFALVDRLTVLENVLTARLSRTSLWRSVLRRFRPEDIALARQLLEGVGLAGYEDQRADKLSGGQRQRVGIARALAQQPLLLLVDEPTASLDPKTARSIMRLVTTLAVERRLPVVINIHDVPLAQSFVARVIGLHDGRIVFDGAPSALTPQVLTEIYGREEWDPSATETAGAP